MEVRAIKEAFDKVITHSQGIPEPKTDKLFDRWFEAKRDIVEMFGDKYIYEYPEKVSFELGNKVKTERINSFINDLVYKWDNCPLADFIKYQEEGFFDNLTVCDYTYNDQIIKQGSKLVKAFKYFESNKRILNDIQSEASRIIQENKIEGTLCFSVHPLDFLSLSENTYNWRSCHALDGEYRAGNLSYMMDKSTFICYLRSDKFEKLPRFPEDVPWNSKKWRVLLYLSADGRMMFAGRQYPFETATGMNVILDILKNNILVNENRSYSNGVNYEWTDWNNKLIDKIEMTNGLIMEFDYPFIPIGDTLLPITDVITDAPGSKHFNDVLDSTCYNPIYAFKYHRYPWLNEGGYSMTSTLSTKFLIGERTYCLQCGEAEVMSRGSETMRCEECELQYGTVENDNFCRCDSCNDRIYSEDVYLFEDELLCEHCYETQTCECERCNERVWKENIRYYKPEGSYICKWCFEDLEEEDDDVGVIE